jgi:hypothetical protein
MSATLDKVLDRWETESLWGWDFPMMAMTACRLGRFDDAVNLLLMDSPKNTYMPNGHNRQCDSGTLSHGSGTLSHDSGALPLYLPGNGGLLIAAAMLAAGFEGKAGSSFPEGFIVKSEGLHAYL